MTHGAGVASAPESYPRARWGSFKVARKVDQWPLTDLWRYGIGEPGGASSERVSARSCGHAGERPAVSVSRSSTARKGKPTRPRVPRNVGHAGWRCDTR